MNKDRRKQLSKIADVISIWEYPISADEIETQKMEIENVLMDEEFAFESMPENLQYSMRGEASQDAQNYMQEAIDAMEEYLSELEDEDNEELKDDFETMRNSVTDSLENAVL